MLHPDILCLGRRLPWCALMLLSACGGPTQAPSEQAARRPLPAPGTTAPLTATQVANATIHGVFDAPFTFTEGSYEGPPTVPGGASHPMAILMTPLVRLGEFDEQSGPAAAALVASNGGGSGEHITLSIVGLRDGKATSIATATVGDRTKVRDLRVSGRDVVLDVVEIGPGEPACCGTQLATRTWRLENGTLRAVAGEVTGTLSLAATVAGHAWTVVGLDGASVAATAPRPTLAFAEGRVTGSAGCNQYRATLAEPRAGKVTVGPTTATRRACIGQAGDIEARFLKTLDKVTTYTFLSGRLVLSGLDGDTMRSITFERDTRLRPDS